MAAKPMSFRDFIAKLKKEGKLAELKKEASLKLELAGVLAGAGGKEGHLAQAAVECVKMVGDGAVVLTGPAVRPVLAVGPG